MRVDKLHSPAIGPLSRRPSLGFIPLLSANMHRSEASQHPVSPLSQCVVLLDTAWNEAFPLFFESQRRSVVAGVAKRQGSGGFEPGKGAVVVLHWAVYHSQRPKTQQLITLDLRHSLSQRTQASLQRRQSGSNRQVHRLGKGHIDGSGLVQSRGLVLKPGKEVS